MERKRIGNDRHVRMTVLRNGTPESFDGKKLTIILWCLKDKIVISEYSILDNVIDFVWYGSEQKTTGKYYITLYENYGDKSMNAVDSRAFVELVPHSFQTHDCDCDIDNGDLSLSLELDSPLLPSNDYNNLNNLPSLNGIELKGDIDIADILNEADREYLASLLFDETIDDKIQEAVKKNLDENILNTLPKATDTDIEEAWEEEKTNQD